MLNEIVTSTVSGTLAGLLTMLIGSRVRPDPAGDSGSVVGVVNNRRTTIDITSTRNVHTHHHDVAKKSNNEQDMLGFYIIGATGLVLAGTAYVKYFDLLMAALTSATAFVASFVLTVTIIAFALRQRITGVNCASLCMQAFGLSVAGYNLWSLRNPPKSGPRFDRMITDARTAGVSGFDVTESASRAVVYQALGYVLTSMVLALVLWSVTDLFARICLANRAAGTPVWAWIVRTYLGTGPLAGVVIAISAMAVLLSSGLAYSVIDNPGT